MTIAIIVMFSHLGLKPSFQPSKYLVEMDPRNPLDYVAVYDTQGLEEDEAGVKIRELRKMLEGKYKVTNQRFLCFMPTIAYFISLLTSSNWLLSLTDGRKN